MVWELRKLHEMQRLRGSKSDSKRSCRPGSWTAGFGPRIPVPFSGEMPYVGNEAVLTLIACVRCEDPRFCCRRLVKARRKHCATNSN